MRQMMWLMVLVCVATGYAQGQPQPPVTRATTAGVLLDVTVVDGKGKPVLDMTRDEFEVSEDGARQQLMSMTLVQPGGAAPAAPTPPAGATAAASPATAPVGSGVETGPTITAILFDRLSPEARPLARRAALAYVSTLVPPHEYAGVFLGDTAFVTVQPFTNEAPPLQQAVDRVTGTVPANTGQVASTRTGGLDPNTAVTASAETGRGFTSQADRQARLNQPGAEGKMARMELQMEEGYRTFITEYEGQTSMTGLRAVVTALAAMPGRKSLLYFTEALPITDRLKPKFEALIGQANRANVTIYPVDAAGLRAHSQNMELAQNVGVAAGQGVGDQPRGDGPMTRELERQDQLLSSRSGAVLGRLAKDTGGFLLENTNNLSAGIGRMQQERTTYYLLAYQPTNAALDGSYRKISVKVKRGKVNVKARPGYIATPLPPQ